MYRIYVSDAQAAQPDQGGADLLAASKRPKRTEPVVCVCPRGLRTRTDAHAHGHTQCHALFKNHNPIETVAAYNCTPLIARRGRR